LIFCHHFLNLVEEVTIVCFFKDKSQIHVKSEHKMFWRDKILMSPNMRFCPMCNMSIISIKMLLLCHLFQSWWAKILLVHIGYCLSKIIVFFWMNCQKREFELFVFQNTVYQCYIWPLKNAMKLTSNWTISTIF